jgi:DNA-binding protein H-NS
MARAPKTDDDTPKADDIIGQLEQLDAIQLGRVIVAAQEMRGTKLQAAREALIARVREEAAALDLDPAELFAKPAPAQKAARKQGRGVVPAAFKSLDGFQTWSGRGKTPNWLVELERNGRSRDEFRVTESAVDHAQREHAAAN